MWLMHANANSCSDHTFGCGSPPYLYIHVSTSCYRKYDIEVFPEALSPKDSGTASRTMESPHRPSSAESISLKEEKEKPWKYIGYKVFSRWVASDPSFFVLRRFGTLNARVALSLQDEIAQLEEKLDFMDKAYSSREIPDFHNGTFRNDLFNEEDDRKVLIRDVLPDKLAKYSKCAPL
jgi:hypothetical protein